MNEEFLLQLIEMIQNVAPDIWSAALRRVYVSAIVNITGCAILAINLLISIKPFIKIVWAKEEGMFKHDGYKYEETTRVMITIFYGTIASIAFILSASAILSSFVKLMSPEFTAIELLLSSVGG